jgi:hypothetical protein
LLVIACDCRDSSDPQKAEADEEEETAAVFVERDRGFNIKVRKSPLVVFNDNRKPRVAVAGQEEMRRFMGLSEPLQKYWRCPRCQLKMLVNLKGARAHDRSCKVVMRKIGVVDPRRDAVVDELKEEEETESIEPVMGVSSPPPAETPDVEEPRVPSPRNKCVKHGPESGAI